ncbi:MAG: hypothetical protein KME01_02550 [Chroococcus sp. CMT-3BRIN-NPC107]|jgi:hypothetical protein|nr:hypothetical protein [Chroococcus sp. CMT-3BRIN-NPC107]
MGVFNRAKANFQNSGMLVQKLIEEYVVFDLQAKQLTLKNKTILLLCQQAELKVDKLTSLIPAPEEGLIATIEQNNIQINLHFTPEKITFKDDCIEGQLHLLAPPQFETESLVYRSLIAAWTIFLGGQIPHQALPDSVRVKGDKIYYTLPRNQLQLLDAFFHNLQTNSYLTTSLKQELIINSAVALSWNNFKLQSLYQALNLKK